MSIASPKQKKRYSLYNMTCNAPEQPPQAESQTLNITGNTSSNVEAGVRKLKSIHRSCRKSDRKREGQLLFFLIIVVSYNARYAKLRGVKNAQFPDFCVPDPAGSFLGLVQAFCAFCTFYHILLFSLSYTYRCFLRYVLLYLFVLFQLRFIIYSLRLWLFICFCVDSTLRVSTRSFLWMLLYVWMLIAYNIKLQRPMTLAGSCHGSLNRLRRFVQV